MANEAAVKIAMRGMEGKAEIWKVESRNPKDQRHDYKTTRPRTTRLWDYLTTEITGKTKNEQARWRGNHFTSFAGFLFNCLNQPEKCSSTTNGHE
jgi:hypothetical protein